MNHAAMSQPKTAADAAVSRAEIASLLRTLGVEVERTRVLGLRVEQAVCALAMSSDRIAESAEGLQDLDRMLQQLAALRDFLGALGRDGGALNDAAIGAALNEILLEDVRLRLSGEAAAESADVHAIELFR